MSFNFIYNPLTNDKYSIFSYEGKSLLKQYIKEYQTGGTSGTSGSKSSSRPKLPTVREAFGSGPILLPTTKNVVPRETYEQTVKMLDNCNEELKLIKTQSARAKDVEEKENDEGGDPTPTNPDEFTIEANTFKMGEFEVELNNENKLGSGGSKIVYKIERGEETFALAKISKDSLKQTEGEFAFKEKEFQNEINCLKELNHPNIVKLYSYSKDAYFHYLLMEYGESNLTSMRGRALKKVELARKFITHMASAILYLKQMNINHRDIKLENFIIVGESPNQVVKLIDFGISTRCPETDGYLETGTPKDVGHEGPQRIFEKGRGSVFYFAPENSKGEPSEVTTHPNDVFSLGLCILELFYEKEPVLPENSASGAIESTVS